MIVKNPLVEVSKDGTICCKVCARRCLIPKGGTGFCGIRKNANGKLDLIVHSRPSAFGIDPIEKKPQFHFLPGTGAYSLGTYGCTFTCKFCCNWELAQAIRENLPMDTWMDLPPKKAVEGAKLHNCASIAYTYNEPAIWYEYHRDIGRLAMKEGLFNVLVTDGYGTPDFWKRASKYLHAASIDFKGFTEKLYSQLCGAHLEPVKRSVIEAKRHGLWVEVTSLIIPGWNDKKDEMQQKAEFLKEIDPEMPLHLIAFHPNYKMMDTPSATEAQLLPLRETALNAGLKYVYIGNVRSEAESTYCPNCSNVLIERNWFQARIKDVFDVERSRCGNCGQKIPGVWTIGQALSLKGSNKAKKLKKMSGKRF